MGVESKQQYFFVKHFEDDNRIEYSILFGSKEKLSGAFVARLKSKKSFFQDREVFSIEELMSTQTIIDKNPYFKFL